MIGFTQYDWLWESGFSLTESRILPIPHSGLRLRKLLFTSFHSLDSSQRLSPIFLVINIAEDISAGQRATIECTEHSYEPGSRFYFNLRHEFRTS